MKEIDFLPQWYRDKRRSQSRYRIQYLGLGCLAIVMVAWTISMIHTISTARSQVAAARTGSAAGAANMEYQGMKVEFDKLHGQNALLSTIDQHLKTSAVMAEFSLLAGDNVKLSRLGIDAEKFKQKEPAAQLPANSIRAVRDVMTDKSGPWEGDIRFKVTIVGIAADATCVAELIGRLERSPWFTAVTPSYCKNGTVGERTVSEFEITCFINNYSEGRKPVTAAVSGRQEQDIAR
jgi:hypothetical protein